MKVIYVTASLPYGPGEAFIIPEIAEITNKGHHVTVVPTYPRGNVIHQDVENILRFVRTEGLLSLGILKGAILQIFRRPAKSIMALMMLFNSRNLYILIKNLTVYLKGLWLAGYASREGVEHLHCHWLSTSATMTMIASLVSGIPWSFTAHRWDIVDNNMLQQKVNYAAFKRFISLSGVKLAQNCLGESLDGQVTVLHMGGYIPPEEKTVAAGKDTARQNENTPVFLCPAKLIRVKGHKYLIEAVRKLREREIKIELWLAGEGELHDTISEQIRLAGLTDSVKLIGQVGHQQLIQFYTDGVITGTILPSIDLGNGEHEGIPVSLIEAMAYAVPVISTSTGGIPELLNGGAGILVSPNNADALADAIEQLVKKKFFRIELGMEGRKRVMEQFSIENTVTELLNLFSACSVRKNTETRNL